MYLLILPFFIILANIWIWWKMKFSWITRILIGLASFYMLWNGWRNYLRAKDAQAPHS
jgi:hypothetical protein